MGLLAAILAVGAGLRFDFLGARSWWFDEALTVVTARIELSALLQRIDADSFTLIRYRAAAPVGVTRVQLAAMALEQTDAAVLIEPELR